MGAAIKTGMRLAFEADPKAEQSGRARTIRKRIPPPRSFSSRLQQMMLRPDAGAMRKPH